MDTFTSLLAGFTIFSILGNLAYEKNVPISEVVGGGSGLAFISYPETIAKFEHVPQVRKYNFPYQYINFNLMYLTKYPILY